MKKLSTKKVSGFILAVVSVLGINFIPFEMWFDDGFSGEMLMVIYAIENAVTFSLSILFVFLFAPKSDDSGKLKTRKEVLQLYLLLGVTFSIAGVIFLFAFIFFVLRAQIDFSALQTAMLWIFAFQIVLFVGNFIMLRSLNLLQAQLFLNRSLGRIFFLFLCVFIGIFIAFFSDRWFVLPFIILKTLIDVGEQIQAFTEKGKENGAVNPLIEKY